MLCCNVSPHGSILIRSNSKYVNTVIVVVSKIEKPVLP